MKEITFIVPRLQYLFFTELNIFKFGLKISSRVEAKAIQQYLTSLIL